MAISRWKPFEEMDRFLDELTFKTSQRFGLSTDVYEDKSNNVVVEMNVAGINPEKMDITVGEDYVKITGSREEKVEKEERDYYLKEIRRGTFERVIDLPVAVSSDEAKAEFENGIVKVIVPKLKQKEGKKVSVKVGKS